MSVYHSCGPVMWQIDQISYQHAGDSRNLRGKFVVAKVPLLHAKKKKISLIWQGLLAQMGHSSCSSQFYLIWDFEQIQLSFSEPTEFNIAYPVMAMAQCKYLPSLPQQRLFSFYQEIADIYDIKNIVAMALFTTKAVEGCQHINL